MRIIVIVVCMYSELRMYGMNVWLWNVYVSWLC